MSATQVLALTQDPEPVLTVVPTLSKTPLRPTPKATPLTIAPTLAPTEAPKAPAPTPTPTLATPPAVAPRSAPTTDLSRTEVPKPAAPTPAPTVAPPPASTAGPATQAAALPNAVVTTAPSSAPTPTPMPQWVNAVPASESTAAPSPTDAPAASSSSSSSPVAQTSPIPLTYPFRNILREIAISGDPKCVSQTEQALALLRQEVPNHYNIVNQYVGIIECVDSGSGMVVRADPPKYLAGSATRDAGNIWYAGTIVHDACHSKQYHDYLAENSAVAVPNHVYIGGKAEAICLAAQIDALGGLGASSHVLQYVRDIIDSKYWEVPYEDRYW